MNSITEIGTLREALTRFFKTTAFHLQPLSGGASARNFFRIDFKKPLYFPVSTILLMTAPVEDTACLEDYINIDFYLKRKGIPTPRIYEMNQANNWLFMEYTSFPTVQKFLQEQPQNMESTLTRLLIFLITMQSRCSFELKCTAFQRHFDKEKYRHEFDFHVKEQLLSFYFKQKLDADTTQRFNDFANEISHRLDVSERVFVHRDFQSSNIFLMGNPPECSFKIIDFQDARSGSPLYDLVSFLWDSYIDVPAEIRNKLLRDYFQQLPRLTIHWRWDEFIRLVDYTVIQRKLHDAGAFAYNYRRFHNSRFLTYIPGAIKMAVEKMQKYSQFSPITEFLKTQGGIRID